jgi:hypothetical protein
MPPSRYPPTPDAQNRSMSKQPPAPPVFAEVASAVTVEPAPGLVLPEPVAPVPSLFGLTPFSAPTRRVSRRGPQQDESQLSLAF